MYIFYCLVTMTTLRNVFYHPENVTLACVPHAFHLVIRNFLLMASSDLLVAYLCVHAWRANEDNLIFYGKKIYTDGKMVMRIMITACNTVSRIMPQSTREKRRRSGNIFSLAPGWRHENKCKIHNNGNNPVNFLAFMEIFLCFIISLVGYERKKKKNEECARKMCHHTKIPMTCSIYIIFENEPDRKEQRRRRKARLKSVGRNNVGHQNRGIFVKKSYVFQDICRFFRFHSIFSIQEKNQPRSDYRSSL